MRENDHMDEAKMRAIAREEFKRLIDDTPILRKGDVEGIVDNAVRKTLQGFGVDIDNPTDVQENFINLRSWSDLKKSISQTLVTTLARSVMLGVVALLIMGFWTWIRTHNPLN